MNKLRFNNIQIKKKMFLNQIRDIAQLGRAPALGAGGRRFKSYYPDYFCSDFALN